MAVQIEHMRVEANGIVFHVAACGPENAPPLFILHGFPESWLSWKPIMERLGDRYRIYAPDLRGYGGSSRPESGYDVTTLTDDVMGLMDALKIEKPTLIGHDWGGALSWVFAHRFSERIKQLVVVNCTHPRTMARAVFKMQDKQHLRSWYIGFFQIPRLPEVLMSTLGARMFRQMYKRFEGRKGSMNFELVDEIARGFRTADDFRGPVNYYRAMGRAQLNPELKERLKIALARPITVPVTMIWGDQDKALSTEVARRSGQDAMCPVDFRVLPGVGHFVSLEAPDELAREIDSVARVTTEKATDRPSREAR